MPARSDIEEHKLTIVPKKRLTVDEISGIFMKADETLDRATLETKALGFGTERGSLLAKEELLMPEVDTVKIDKGPPDRDDTKDEIASNRRYFDTVRQGS